MSAYREAGTRSGKGWPRFGVRYQVTGAHALSLLVQHPRFCDPMHRGPNPCRIGRGDERRMHHVSCGYV